MRKLILVLLVGCGGAAEPAKSKALPDPPPRARSEHANMASPEAYDDIAQVFAKRRPMIGQCYAQLVSAGKLSAKARGRVTLAMKITAGGDVKDVYIPQDTLESKEMEACLMAMVEKWTVPPPNAAVDFSFSYEFQPD